MGIAKKTRPIAFKLIIISFAAKNFLFRRYITGTVSYAPVLLRPGSWREKQMTIALSAKADVFRKMHSAPPILILPNAWDAVTARLFVKAGARAIATTSAGIAASLGYPDGQNVPRELMMEAIARIARVVDVPVTADIESGYADSPKELGESIRAVIHAGAIGFNLEDATRRSFAAAVCSKTANRANTSSARRRGQHEAYARSSTLARMFTLPKLVSLRVDSPRPCVGSMPIVKQAQIVYSFRVSRICPHSQSWFVACRVLSMS